jgi:O-antigen/teichoic acid export membrane protein
MLRLLLMQLLNGTTEMGVRENTTINIVGAIIPMFVMLFTVPLYLKTLGDVRYGVLALVWLVLGYFGFLEMGLGKATANHISRLHGSSREKRAEVFWSALLVNAAFGVVAALILWCIGSYLMTNVLKMPAEFQDETLAALPWMILTLPLALVSSVLNGALEGRNKFWVVNVLQIVSTVVFQIVPLVVAYLFSPTLAYVIPAAVISRAAMNVPFLLACVHFVPLTVRPVFSWQAVRSLLSYGGWVAITGMLSPLLETIDRFLIGAVVGAQAVTYYTLPFQLVTKIRIIPAGLSRALFPKFSSATPGEADLLALTALRSLMLVMTPIIVCGVIFLRPFIDLWVGKEVSSVAAPLGEILLVGVWANSLSYIPYSLLQGKGYPDVVAKFQMLIAVPFILVIYGGVYLWGGYGAALAWVVRVIFSAIFLFRFSGILKGLLSIVIAPAGIILAVIGSVHYISDKIWYWRVGLIFLSVFFVSAWIKQSHGYEILKQILPVRKNGSSI